VHCLCANVCCAAATGWLPNFSLTNITHTHTHTHIYIYILLRVSYYLLTKCSSRIVARRHKQNTRTIQNQTIFSCPHCVGVWRSGGMWVWDVTQYIYCFFNVLLYNIIYNIYVFIIQYVIYNTINTIYNVYVL
jgi:hypothetical protein